MTIAIREFRHTVLTKGFIFGAILFPLVMFVVIGVMPFLLSNDQVPVRGTIVVADSDGSVAQAIEIAFARYQTKIQTGIGSSTASLRLRQCIAERGGA